MFFKVSFGLDQDCFLYFGPKLKHFNVKLIWRPYVQNWEI